eukprot:4566962-Pleurochrysis_carterae.AAC.1
MSSSQRRVTRNEQKGRPQGEEWESQSARYSTGPESCIRLGCQVRSCSAWVQCIFEREGQRKREGGPWVRERERKSRSERCGSVQVATQRRRKENDGNSVGTAAKAQDPNWD